MSSDLPLPVTLRSSRWKTAPLCFASLLFTFAGFWMAHEGQSIGYWCGGFFSLCLVVFAVQLHPKSTYLRLAPDGFTFCTLFRAHTVRWEQVQEFGVTSVGLNRMVAWNFKPDYPASGRARAISKSLSGYEAAFPDRYGLTVHELAELLEGLREKYGEAWRP